MPDSTTATTTTTPAPHTSHPPLDVTAYLRRIGWSGAPRPDVATLRAVQTAHLLAVPFENLDALRGIAPSLALADLTGKLLDRPRGGYCYEHNTLFAAVLEAIGFRVTRLAARVVVGAVSWNSRPRTHMALLVEVPGEPEPYLADVGFGSIGALPTAVPLVPETEFRAGSRCHRLVRAPHPGPLPLWVLQARHPGAGPGGAAGDWEAQYVFTLEPFEPADFEVINWHIATNPRSPFTSALHVQRTLTAEHRSLAGRQFRVTRADGTVTERELPDETEARRVLAEEFGIIAPDGMVLLGGRPTTELPPAGD
ncbi:arylamine N-acetyltransferase [Streptomyces sp. LP05-1]|uniref:Arylamine N-acetyltransferase n=1 Tax=Streptomyces pyxinae TaxID=2970734 RepID=A0ABT2CLR1_9ACTN|nr:arylamine N-acetyltransferase [Streptomyces sp. LP05-1]MCS0637504.1 arylamine N-acetyltransferase [Streptomyces sp. LP05-1]